MDSALPAWLEDTFDAQLLLGIHWLRGSIQRKRSGLKPDPGWETLYQDNGSSLEIFTEFHEGRVLQVIKKSPLVVSDGHLSVAASLTLPCQQDFANRYHKRRRSGAQISAQLYSLIVVSKSNIRATSYGPPLDRIHLVIDRLDWERGPYAQVVGRPTPCTVSVTLVGLLSRLERTRAIEDVKYASEAPLLPDASMSQQNPIQIDREDDDMLDNSFDVSNTDFATQAYTELAPHPEERDPRRRSRGGGGSERSMQPIMMGHIKSREIHPDDGSLRGKGNRFDKGKMRAQPPTKEHAALLNLIHGRNPQSNSRRAPVGHELDADKDRESDGSDSDTRQTLGKPPTGIWADAAEKGRLKALAKSTSPAVRRPVSLEKSSPSKSKASPEPETSRAEAEWLNDWHLDSESARVPSEQVKLLIRQDSWHKPPPGFRFTDGSMPIQTYQEILALVEEQCMTEEVEAEMETDDESVDQLNVYQEGADGQDEGLGLAEQDEDDLSDAVSWSSSPAPQTPKLATKGNRNLPPDSSFEAVQYTSAKKVVRPRASSISQALVDEQPSPDPPSSPPIPAGTNSTEDMDMEIDVPQGLGYDQPAPAPVSKPGASVMLSPGYPRQESVVQVKDTPYTKGKDGRLLPLAKPQASSQNQASNGTSKDTLSTSIVHGTYNDPTSSNDRRSINVGSTHPNVQADAFDKRRTVQIADTETVDVFMVNASTPTDQNQRRTSATEEDAKAVPQFASDEIAAPESGRTGTLSPNHRVTMKRKSSGSPSKSSPRHVKKRGIKVSSFSQLSPPSQDPETSHRKIKTEFVQKVREDRVKEATSMTPPSRPKSRPPTPSNTVNNTQSPIEDFKSLKLADPSKRMVGTPSRTPQGLTSGSSRHAQTMPSPTPLLSRTKPSPQAEHINGKHVPQARTHPIRIFDQFRTMYPEYTGDEQHFTNLCRQMYHLEQEDRMLPKSQWDDFVIRNRTDYTDYVMRCLDISVEHSPYLRFYKDHISDRIFDKGVLKDQATLITALKQLGSAPLQRSPAPARAIRPRQSIEWGALLGPSDTSSSQVFQQAAPPVDRRLTKETLVPADLGRDNNARHREVPQRPAYGSPKTIGSLSSMTNSNIRQTVPPVPRKNDASSRMNSHEHYLIEQFDDAVQDFVVGHQKLTSWTGSSSVTGNRKWPSNLAIRPAITRPSRANILSWKDEL
ncbi:hypothetical protein K491DRAFT_781818 [Lophiostoma macrostomum CBS 122681]|uniref:Telomere replication protein EST3 n=1 Tax=Lophiostoma macrostomum CBS 122681 TaxID=1314788 RepID=A0A6A6SV10_9PLEO|nr:hypothetical protein K491DRAFT_781818 [Lophiostoma macrostomum CBS 122681]